MNRGGDPERDDYGLPPVDIEIPDDARELDREVQAYHRELRAQRRLRLARRLGGPLTREGMILPLLASCLALTLLAGTLLTMFTARRVPPPAAQSTSAPRRVTPAVGKVGGLLPAGSVVADGKPVQLRNLRSSVLALVPVGCHCAAAARQLITQATAANVVLYFVAAGNALSQATALARRSKASTVHVVSDARGTLAGTYRPTGLTAVLVFADGSVSNIMKNLGPTAHLESSLRALAGISPQGLDRPGDTVLAANTAGQRAA
ncbi:MAG TPA: hypothetical protein VMV92_18560 [Streptosporangiaceae bacterium]|nr:hypothetical protein [Streptosporangiaceae bacterium]